MAAIEEFFESSDMDEVAERILELEDPGLHHIFVKHAVQKAMDRRDREREMISNLLSFLYPQVLSGDFIVIMEQFSESKGIILLGGCRGSIGTGVYTFVACGRGSCPRQSGSCSFSHKFLGTHHCR